ncbi:MAG: hypothetical protein HY665_09495 [Chloroflexi bacterium]|nr:hypothetical protein [Chloroflexota bacterium]
MEGKIVYFAKPGRENTDDVLQIARKRARELGIKTILLASNWGYTAVRATEVLEGLKVVVVRSIFRGTWTDEDKKKVESRGATIFSGTHAFQGLNAGMRQKFGMYLPNDIIANTLRIFSEGMKVVCEISLMAADAGLVSVDEDIIVIAGTHKGADTAVVLRPVHSNDFFELRVKEVLCKPYVNPPHPNVNPQPDETSLYTTRTKAKVGQAS